MSFSYELKTELSAVIDSARHCRIAETAAFVWFLSEKTAEEVLRFYASNKLPLLAASELIKKLFGVNAEPMLSQTGAGNRRYELTIEGADSCTEVYKALKMSLGSTMTDPQALVSKQCCKRAFLRGAFLCAGTISDPEKGYHIEINCKKEEQALFLAELLHSLHIPARVLKRRRYVSVYVKDSEQISDVLGLMGARVSLLDLENERILHSMRGSVNRQVNCETANIHKTAAASARQIEDIQFILAYGEKGALSGGLDEIARIRLEYPEATLQELGEMLNPPVGKSGINHRLRKIAKIAEDLRMKEI